MTEQPFTEIVAIDAHDGALAGYAATCNHCGMRITDMIVSNLQFEMQAHTRWHDNQRMVGRVLGPDAARSLADRRRGR